MRAMKNYAGHRLSPWLGHLMVSRQETAHPLLTPGEVMQLPVDDELVLVSGVPPIRKREKQLLVEQEGEHHMDARAAAKICPELGEMDVGLGQQNRIAPTPGQELAKLAEEFVMA
jgi:type IV secretion system protein VirD4